MNLSTPVDSFNLIDEGWVQCLMTDGSVKCLSLRETFEQLSSIKRLAGDSIQQDYAVFRVLLTIFWRAHAETDAVQECEDVLDWWEELIDGDATALSEPVFSYLEQHRNRFDLLDSKAPFMQVADLATDKGKHADIQRLIPEAELDYFTMRAGTGRSSLSLAEATRWLIAIQAWDYSGIKPGAVGDPRIKGRRGYPIGTGWAGFTGGVVLQGTHLAQTLMLNTPANIVFSEDTVEGDLPVWEREPASAAPRLSEYPEGPCDVLTWQSRRVRLFRQAGNDRVTGVLVTNGDKIEIRNQFKDPMTGYRYSKDQSKKGAPPVFFAKTHSEERTLWRGVEALLAGEQLQDIPKGGEPDITPATLRFLHTLRDYELVTSDQDVRVELVGFVYGPKSSTITNSIHEVIPFRLGTLLAKDETLASRIVLAAKRAVEASIHLGQFAGFLSEAAGGEYAFIPEAAGSVLNGLETSYKEWLLTITPDAQLDQRFNIWCDTVEKAIHDQANILARGAGAKALVGRIDPKSEESKPRLLSTSTAFTRLENSLRKTLERIPLD